MRALVLLFSIISISVSATAAVPAPALQMPASNWAYVNKQLQLAGLSDAFIKSLSKNYETKDFEEVVRLNVLLFLKKSDYHGAQITDQAASEVSEFASAHKDRLKKAEIQFGVSGSVVASLLWLESRYGKNAGHFHVPSVYLDLVQAPRPEVQSYLLTQTGRYTASITNEQHAKILNRTHDKAKFAIGELLALQKAFAWKWDLSDDFRGSFSGAFGMPQFLPSSYIHFARAVDPKNQPHLDQADDAIMSVAYFLRMHGWKPKVKAAQLQALLSYNNSLDYANAILTLAAKI
jgi:membrane-bound lytic murein transglycosylase B